MGGLPFRNSQILTFQSSRAMAILSVLLSLALMIAYALVFIFKHGVPPSLSESFYVIKHKITFSLTLVASGALVLVPWIDVSDKGEGLAFLAVAGMFFVAASPQFKESLSREVHYVSACIMAAACIVWELLNGGVWLPLGVFLIIGLCNRKNIIFWLEIGLLLDAELSIIAKLISESMRGAM